MISCRQDGEGVLIDVHVQPGARRDQVVGAYGGALKLAVQAPPEKGRANKAVVKLMARVLGLRRSDVAIVRGETGRRKVVRVAGVTVDRVRALAEERSKAG